MAGRSLLPLLLLAAALLGRGYGDSFDDFSLADALDDSSTKRPTPKLPKRPLDGTATPKLPRKPSGGTGDFDLSDYFDTPPETTTKPGKATTRPYPKKPDDISLWDVIHTTTTKKPKTTKAPPKKNPAKDPADFDLSDALDDQNDGKGGGKPNVKPGEGSKGKDNPSRGGKQAFSDDDLAGVLDDGKYHPDKKKGGSDYDAGTTAETGTIAGIASALVVALVGAVSSYISYQQKKFCFSIQRKWFKRSEQSTEPAGERGGKPPSPEGPHEVQQPSPFLCKRRGLQPLGRALQGFVRGQPHPESSEKLTHPEAAVTSGLWYPPCTGAASVHGNGAAWLCS
ncbi:GTP cyclohydrolase 1 feedback regulatory protein [Platysternon megacephalum]|uniref:CD99 antigen-like protein 2 n=1 Tax=Platysternon megacephalum TaxID=55544 RepID=A0A4D9F1H5_9SAUR|nr:GTP cyclohydrolase 1 feedback regulatory protein [Platysternon megacephalum]